MHTEETTPDTTTANGAAPRTRKPKLEPVTGGTDYIAARQQATKELHSERTRLAKRIEQIDAELGIPVRGASMAGVAAAMMLAPSKPKKAAAKLAKPKPARVAKPKSPRLPRRSKEAIADSLETIVALLVDHPAGLRAEEIREKLQLQAKEMPRVLKLGLAEERLECSGTKRATVYRKAAV